MIDNSFRPAHFEWTVEGAVDVYDANAGTYLHTVYGVGETPYMIHRIE